MPRLAFVSLFVLGCAAGPHSKEQVFWAWFAKNADRIAAADPATVVATDRMNTELDRIDPGLVFELPSGKIDGRRILVISADGQRKLFPAVERLVAVAPDIPGWRIVKFRPRTPDPSSLQLDMADLHVDVNDLHYRSEVDGDKLAIVVFMKGYDGGSLHHKQAVFLMLDAVLGEYDVETRIGGIDVRPWDDAAAKLPSLVALRAEVDRWKARH